MKKMYTFKLYINNVYINYMYCIFFLNIIVRIASAVLNRYWFEKFNENVRALLLSLLMNVAIRTDMSRG